MDGRSDDILIGYTDISHQLAIVVNGINRLAASRRNRRDNHRSAIGMECLKAYLRLRLAVFIGGSMHHVYLFLRLYARYVAVVTNSDEQPPAIGIGKSRHRLRQFHCILYLIFKVLLTVFSL